MEQSLNEKLGIIQTELKSKKSRYNSFGKYYFRSAEDILEAIKPFLIPMNLSVRITEELIAETMHSLSSLSSFFTSDLGSITIDCCCIFYNSFGKKFREPLGSDVFYVCQLFTS